MAALADIKIHQGTRPVKVAVRGRTWDGLFHLFYASDGKPMAIVETYCGAVQYVPAEAISFQDVDWRVRERLPSTHWE